jgi:hypothetical protein
VGGTFVLSKIGSDKVAIPCVTAETVKEMVSPCMGFPKASESTSRVKPPAVSGFDTSAEGGVCPTPMLGGAGGCEVFVVELPILGEDAMLRI